MVENYSRGLLEKVSAVKESYTGKFIREIIGNNSIKRLPKNIIYDILES